MILYGASGHAKVIIDICVKNEEKITAIIDYNKEIISLLEYPVLQIENLNSGSDKFLISIGNNSVRKKIVNSIVCEFGIAIHPNTIIDKTVEISEGSVVMAGSIINSCTKIGKHCIINTSSSVDHDCFIEDFVHVSPNATLCGGVRIGEGSQIGAGAVVIPNITIGKWCTIGAGTVVINDVPDKATIVGNPGRKVK